MMLKIIVLLLLSTNLVQAEELRRLFYTQSERALLDQQRELENTPKTESSAVIPETGTIEMKGYVKRSGKKDVFWVNENNTLKSNKPLSDVKVIRESNGRVTLKVQGQGRVRLKPGEVFSRSQQSTIEAYEKK